MHELEFADAVRPERFTILWIPLLDYSIGHELTLQKRRNPLVLMLEEDFKELPANLRANALRDAVLVCSEIMPRWKKFWAMRCAKLSGEETEKQIQEFRRYRAASSMTFPLRSQPKVQGGHYHYFGGPEMGRLINYVGTHHRDMIQAHFGGSPLNFPLGLARCLYLSHLETEGQVWIENWHDVQDKTRAKAFEGCELDGFAVGEEAVQALAEKWNLANPGAKVALPGSPKARVKS